MNTNIESRLAVLEADCGTTKSKLGAAWVITLLATSGVVVASVGRNADAQGYGVTLAQLVTRMTSVEAKTQFFSTDGNPADGGNMYITGANLHLRSGLGTTSGGADGAVVVNGRGNLIVGYNHAQGNDAGQRTGSHNVIVGDYHTYTSCGGLVVGYGNNITGPFATVLGGVNNTASGKLSVVAGGYSNTASGDHSVVSGGSNRTAPSQFNWAGGGYFQNN